MTRLFNITQPAVSRILQHAELQLCFVLLPTSEALTLHPHIEQLFAQLDNFKR